MKILKYSLPLILLLAVTQVKAQNPLISQYYLNSYILNPSLAGVSGNLSALAAYRQDFIGFDDAPRAQTLSFETPFKDEKFGIGAYLHNTTIGPQRRTGFQASYAYHIDFQDDVKVSFGLGANVWNTSIDFMSLIQDDFTNNDPIFLGENASATTFDATAGVNFSTKNFYTGFSVMNLAELGSRFSDDSGPFMYNARHYYWLTGFNIPIIDSVLDFEPSFLIKYANGNSPQADINGRFLYKDFFWIGASYRARSTAVGAVGMRVKEMIDVGYSYDMHLSPINQFGGPSHEITIKYTLDLSPEVVILEDTIPDIYASDTGTIDTIVEVPPVDTLAEDSNIVAVDTPAVAPDPVIEDDGYADKIAEADQLFAEENWPLAAQAYREAQGIRPEEEYPAQRLEAIAEAEDRESSVAAAEKARQDSLAQVEKARQDSLAQAEQARKDSLAQAEKAKRDSIAAAKEAEVKTTTVGDEKVEQFDNENPFNYVIAGSFGSFDNAKKLKKDLSSKGYDVKIIEHKERNFYRVTLFKSLDSLEAEKFKEQARKDLNNPGIWVLEGQKYQKDVEVLDQKEQDEKEEAEKQPVIKRTVEVATKEEAGTKLEILDENNRFYHIIAGSFGSLENAVKLRDEYNGKGYEAKILLDKDRNLYRVALYSSLEADAARRELAKLQAAISPTLWLLRK